jgi:1,4-alpha-glucan branching enzyme
MNRVFGLLTLFILVFSFLYSCTHAPMVTGTYEVTTNVEVKTNVYNTNGLYVVNIISNVYEPFPTELLVYVYTNDNLNTWSTHELYYWYTDNGQNGYVSKLSNYNEFLVFKITNFDVRRKIGIKLRANPSWTPQEPIKTENGPMYDRIITIPLYTITNSNVIKVSNVVGTNVYLTNFVSYSVSTPGKVFVHSPANWWESFPYFFEYETNIYRDPPTNKVFEWFGAEYQGSGVTYFLFYAPNVRRVWVAGDFSDWKKVDMYLSKDRVWWWAIVSNTFPGQKYKFVIEKYNDPSLHWVSDPGAKKNIYSPAMDTIGNESVIIDHSSYTWQSSTWQRPGYEYPIIYQLHIRTFYTNGPGDYYGWGSFETAINKFDYLTNLGVTAIEPLPIMEFAGDQSWGYNYVLFYAPETAYVGTNLTTVNTFKKFVDEAHKRGMAVILDLVFNHIGPGDDIIAAIDPAYDWVNPQTYWYSGSTPWGPRFNYSNPIVRKFLIESAKYMMKHYRIDGFRFDATAYIGDWGFLQHVTTELRNFASSDGYGPNVILIAEHLPNDAWVTRKVSAGGAGFDSQWNANLSHELKNLFTSGSLAVDINNISSYIQCSGLDNGFDNQNLYGLVAVQYLSSHDEVANGKRRPARDLKDRGWGDSEYDAQAQTITALATVIMARGYPMIFMGDEFLEGYYPGNQEYFKDDQPITWANLMNSRATNTMRAVRDLIMIRKNNAPIKYDQIGVIHINNADKVIGFRRGYGTGSGDIYVIINYNKRSYTSYGIPFPSTGTWNLIFAHPSGAYGDSGADSYLTDSVNYLGGYAYIKIPEYGVLIYKKQ